MYGGKAETGCVPGGDNAMASRTTREAPMGRMPPPMAPGRAAATGAGLPFKVSGEERSKLINILKSWYYVR